MKNNKSKNILLGVLAVGLVGMTVAYAALSQKLDIKSTAKVKASTWDIHFENLSTAQTVGTGKVVTEPTLSATQITGLNVKLQKPGDSVSYIFDIKNAGTIDSKIGEYKINTKDDGIVCTDESGSTDSADATLVCNNLKYTIVYSEDTTADQTGDVISSGSSFTTDQQLKAGNKISAKLTVTYDGDAVPTNDVTITGLDAYMIYNQN